MTMVAAAPIARPTQVIVCAKRGCFARLPSAASRETKMRHLSSGGGVGCFGARSLPDTLKVSLGCYDAGSRLRPASLVPLGAGARHGSGWPAFADRSREAGARSLGSLYLTAQRAMRFLMERQAALLHVAPPTLGTVL